METCECEEQVCVFFSETTIAAANVWAKSVRRSYVAYYSTPNRQKCPEMTPTLNRMDSLLLEVELALSQLSCFQ